MNKVTIVVTFLQGEITTITDKPFTEALQSIFSEKFDNLVPLKIEFPKTGKILYADKNVFEALIKNEVSTEIVIQATQCDGIYRNNEDIIIGNFDYTIDRGSLWLKKGNNCELVNEDEYITYPFDSSEFKEV